MDGGTGADILPNHIDRASVGGDSGETDVRELDQLSVDDDDDEDESEDEAGDRPSA